MLFLFMYRSVPKPKDTCTTRRSFIYLIIEREFKLNQGICYFSFQWLTQAKDDKMTDIILGRTRKRNEFFSFFFPVIQDMGFFLVSHHPSIETTPPFFFYQLTKRGGEKDFLISQTMQKKKTHKRFSVLSNLNVTM